MFAAMFLLPEAVGLQYLKRDGEAVVVLLSEVSRS